MTDAALRSMDRMMRRAVLTSRRPALFLHGLLYAATEGAGVVQLPDIISDHALVSGALVNVLPEWRPVAGTVQAVFASRRGLLPSVRGLIDHLAAAYQNPRSASGPPPAPRLPLHPLVDIVVKVWRIRRTAARH